MTITIKLSLDDRQATDLREVAEAQRKTLEAHVACVVDAVLPGSVAAVRVE